MKLDSLEQEQIYIAEYEGKDPFVRRFDFRHFDRRFVYRYNQRLFWLSAQMVSTVIEESEWVDYKIICKVSIKREGVLKHLKNIRELLNSTYELRHKIDIGVLHKHGAILGDISEGLNRLNNYFTTVAKAFINQTLQEQGETNNEG